MLDNWKRTYLDPDEQRIEEQVERMFNRLDARLMRNELTQAQYDREADKIGKWSEEQYRGIHSA
jgi:hypothetical protein